MMATKVCPNSDCRAYAHFVYTVAVRCVLCRCDLVAAKRIAAMAAVAPNNTSRMEAQSSRSGATHAAR
jgi:hypothetical protein